jgi:hypothetical protein
LEKAFSSEELVGLLGKRDLLEEDEAELRKCISEETARRVTLGMMFQEGISEESLTCMSAKIDGVSFLDLMNTQDMEGLSEEMIPIIRAMYTCLSEEELSRAGILDMGEGEGPTPGQIKCIFEAADDDTLAQFIEFGEGGGAGTMPPAELIELLLQCGIFPSSGG